MNRYSKDVFKEPSVKYGVSESGCRPRETCFSYLIWTGAQYSKKKVQYCESLDGAKILSGYC